MKKMFCLFVIFCAVCITGCSNNLHKIVFENMSDVRINYFEGNNKLFYATLSSGYREQIFAYDGRSDQSVECGVLTLGFYESHDYSKIQVILKIDEQQKEYILEKSPYEDVFMCDIEKIVNSNAAIEVVLKNSDNKASLKCLSNNWDTDYKKAIEIGVNYFYKQLNVLYFNNKLNAECYLKVVKKQDFNEAYWYFSVIDLGGNNFSVLIDVESGKILDN